MPTQEDSGDQHALRFADVYWEEMRLILGGLPDQPVRDFAVDDTPESAANERRYTERLFAEAARQGGEHLAALCLSGGGIRSATFALGVLQGLARFGVLGRFQYLSSVSGGGYIASWLSAWRSLAPDSEVLAKLNKAMQTGVEAAQITGIREDSNYLTPRLGLLSADTWTVIALYVRNLLLNWLLFVPFFMGCFMFPRLCAAIMDFIIRHQPTHSMFSWARYLGAALTIFGLSVSVLGRFVREKPWLTNLRFRLLVLPSLMTASAAFTLAAIIAGNQADPQVAAEFASTHISFGIVMGAIMYFGSWSLGRFFAYDHTRPAEKRIEWDDVFWWTVSGALVGAFGAVGMGQFAGSFATMSAGNAVKLAEVFGLSVFILAYLIGELLYVGLASLSKKGDMDREWLARSSGWLAATAVGWALLSAIALYGPDLLRLGTKTAIAAITAGGVSGLTTLILGSGKLTAATSAKETLKNLPWMRVASAAAVVFAALAASLLALMDEAAERALLSIAIVIEWRIPRVCVDVALMLGLLGSALVLSRFINVNRFSMHALYRNRLVRAFVGSARANPEDGAEAATAGLIRRDPDPFTGFDPEDDVRLHEIEPRGEADRSKLFHVINATLNVVATRKLAWQQRKAESFTMTRLHCGNPTVSYRATSSYGGGKEAGVSLGTAMAISGAAVSPNQGYNSSPLIGLLLMLFNVRLGWWLGNPSCQSYSKDGPVYSLSAALRELVGDTTDTSKWVYLSDGGHFENLGLYEMVRRRCRTIVVSDAGCDPECTFEDLGNAVRKVFIDFGVSIDFEKLEIRARQNPPVPGIRFAIGRITYPGSTQPGWLLYLKPTYMGIERTDIRSYASGSSSFPHESTTDQWFSESQLEAYRALGASTMEFVLSGGEGVPPGETPDPMTIEDFRNVADRLLIKETFEG